MVPKEEISYVKIYLVLSLCKLSQATLSEGSPEHNNGQPYNFVFALFCLGQIKHFAGGKMKSYLQTWKSEAQKKKEKIHTQVSVI